MPKEIQMTNLMSKTDDELFEMGKKSNQISKQILPEIWASEIAYIIQKQSILTR